jgi:HNH endonuclease
VLELYTGYPANADQLFYDLKNGIVDSHSIETSEMISLLKSDYNERDIVQADKYYKQILENETLSCVWSGREIRSRENMHIDHMIPFSVLRNNDLWNLLPATIKENSNKKDKIPSSGLLANAGVKERIVDRWGDLYLRHGDQFRTEVQVALLGRTGFREKSWKNESYRRVSEMCHHMIEERGFEPWER